MRIQFDLKTKTTNILEIPDADLGTILFALSQIDEKVISKKAIADVKRVEATIRVLTMSAEIIK
jgi:hypothetical protein